MTQRQLREQEVQIARYQFLSREVTDPLAACLVRIVIGELEDGLRRDRELALAACDATARYPPFKGLAN